MIKYITIFLYGRKGLIALEKIYGLYFTKVEFENVVENPDNNVYVNLVVNNSVDFMSRIKEYSTLDSLVKNTFYLEQAPKIILSHRLQNKRIKLPSGKVLKFGPRPKIIPEITGSDIYFFVLD